MLRFALLATTIACTDQRDPGCERTGSELPANDVRIEIRSSGGADRPVVIHDRDGAIVEELVTDASGVVQIATVPGNASVTVDLGDFTFEASNSSWPTLVTYFGLTSGDSLVLGAPDRPPRPIGSAIVTLRFVEPTDFEIGGYDVSLGGNCGAIGTFASTGRGAARELAIATDCLFDPGLATVVALAPVDDHVVAGARAPFSVANGGTTTVDLGPWQLASNAILSVSGQLPDGGFEPEVFTMLTAYVGDELVFVDQVIQPAPYSFRMPFVPSIYDRVGVSVSLPTGSFTKITTQPVDLAVEDWLPAVGGFQLDDPRDGAPSLSWGHDYLEQLAVAFYSIESNSRGFRRFVVRHDHGCSCTLPPLPSHFRDLIPDFDDVDIHINAGVSLLQSPDLGGDELVRVLDPLGNADLPDDVGVYATGKGEFFVINPGMDPS